MLAPLYYNPSLIITIFYQNPNLIPSPPLPTPHRSRKNNNVIVHLLQSEKIKTFSPALFSTSSCLSPQDPPLEEEKEVLCVATSATILVEKTLSLISDNWAPHICLSASRKLLLPYLTIHRVAASPSLALCPHFTRFSGQCRNSKFWGQKIGFILRWEKARSF